MHYTQRIFRVVRDSFFFLVYISNKSLHSVRVIYVPGTVLSTLCIISHSLITGTHKNGKSELTFSSFHI